MKAGLIFCFALALCASESCKNNRPDCDLLKSLGYCITHRIKMKEFCPVTCDLCPIAYKCKDQSGTAKCGELQHYCHLTSLKKRMQEICFKTCGYCKIQKPKCVATKHGCCWDKHTAKKDKVGSNCKACKDYNIICRTFKDDCLSSKRVGKFMRNNCPITCQLCEIQKPKCVETTHGCCWDKHTAKKNKVGSNCKACKDKYKSMCRKAKADCRSSNKKGKFMTNNCPRTCQLCEIQTPKCVETTHGCCWDKHTAKKDKVGSNCKAAVCKKKTTTNVCCKLPFIYKGKSYSDCTGVDHTKEWCSTTSNYDKDKKWGTCKDSKV